MRNPNCDTAPKTVWQQSGKTLTGHWHDQYLIHEDDTVFEAKRGWKTFNEGLFYVRHYCGESRLDAEAKQKKGSRYRD